MPDTPGKRQRNASKAKRREVKEERRAARKAEGMPAPTNPETDVWGTGPDGDVRTQEPTDAEQREGV
jgi:hypothetical protein